LKQNEYCFDTVLLTSQVNTF